MDVPQPKLCTDFHQIFSICLPQEDLELIRFGGHLVTTVAMATHFKIFGFLALVGVPQTKPMHEFSSNFQDMFTEERSTAE